MSFRHLLNLLARIHVFAIYIIPCLFRRITAIKVKAAERPPHVILAGQPGDLAEALTAAGVDEFIHARSDVLEVLGRLAARMEVDA